MIRPVARRLRGVAAVVALVTCLGTVAACQSQSSVNRQPHTGSGSASVVNGVQQIRLTTGNDYRFHPSTFTVHPGLVRLLLVNTGSAPHDWSLNGFPADAVPLTSGGVTSTVQFTAPRPGRYTFVCTIHERQGQTGTMIVTS